ncbi:cyclophilin type peptidyl-prolyl cis-transisomerase [Leptotrichia hongkongensis]|uniref:Peptidyl-prolyl cis-trans isomerase n=1 Tax=Leptotrichia hongkongensis TaxID=554406 RepID=A0A510LC99_9FUSO|nr:peptidylprolyl isomerase [Leptotrichia hongkongensis]BBM60263.1 cyclophilin type peptidyl-prolyl cis-transisomerase [Leptotrichia hongkongensis]
MKKIVILVSVLMLLMVNIVNAKSNKAKKRIGDKKFEKIMKDFQLEAVIETTKGNISVYLYPEAAPKNVANFVFLAKNNFYNGLTFHRVIPNGLVQGGDPLGNGTGTAGYFLNDEISDWLNFDNEGMLAFANSGPNTNSSQFFITMQAMSSLNGKHTIIGGTKSREDLSVLRTIRQDDKILNIDIKGRKVDKFLDYFSEEVSEWERKLEKPVNHE